MRPMERYYYLRDTQKICSQCKVLNRLSSFFNKQDITINKYCNKCNKKNTKQDIMKMVLSIMKEGVK